MAHNGKTHASMLEPLLESVAAAGLRRTEFSLLNAADLLVDDIVIVRI